MGKSAATRPTRLVSARLESIFDKIAPLETDDRDKPLYAAMPVPGCESYFVGKDPQGYACLLVAASDHPRNMQAPIRLENLDVQFDLRCHLRRDNEVEGEGVFTVIRCRSIDHEFIRYFLSVCLTIIRVVGDAPRRGELASAIHRLAAIFQKLQSPAVRSVYGLFGELYLISRSGSPSTAVRAWRVDDTARFDFAEGNVRLDVKATSGRVRAHTFSYEQCNPPTDTVAVVASLFAERSPSGISIRELIEHIEARVAAHADLVLKLHEVVTSTLGIGLTEALSIAFDERLAESSLRFYDLCTVPAIRGDLQAGVSDVHFRSDLSALSSATVRSLVEKDAAFLDLLPFSGA
jgi:hypothetical protein